MRAIAIELGLDERFFNPYTDAGDNTLRLLHYTKTSSKEVFVRNKDQVSTPTWEHYPLVCRFAAHEACLPMPPRFQELVRLAVPPALLSQW